MSRKTRIIYLGTPEFAVAGLRALVESGYNVVAVVTMPDKPAGRGHKVQFSAVKQYALEAGIPILQPEKLKDTRFLEELHSYNAELQIVTAFRMLPEAVWAMPRLGTFNLHASLLPQYRGAAPINWAVINGEKETGVTTFMLKHEIDTGNIILQEKLKIGDTEDVGSLHDRLMELGVKLTLQTVDLICDCDSKGIALPTTVQPMIDNLKPAPKIFKDDCRIDFSRSAEEIYNFVRGLSPYPAAWCELDIAGQHFDNVKVFRVEPQHPNAKQDDACSVCPQAVISVACKNGFVSIEELQIPGKKRMDARSLLNGLRNRVTN